uniref:histidine kinase n=1 Tax=Schlesneria paludicola TaxID=360056 RepID=A0A7C2JXD7_9PLAN
MADEDTTRWLAMLGHDLIAPLVTIQGFLTLIEDDARRGDWSRFEQDVSCVNRACDHMRRLLEDLRALARGEPSTAQDATPLAPLVDAARVALAAAIARQNVEIRVAADLPVVRGNATQLARVLQNLLDNALAALHGQPDPRVEIAACREGGVVRVTVRDNGRGLTTEERQALSQPPLPESARSGRGLGLQIVRQFVEAHGGSLGIESAGPGQGVTAWFTLPAGE